MKTLLLLAILQATTVKTLTNGEVWTTIYLRGEPLAFQLTPDMPTAGQFHTFIVRPLPASDIVGSPQSVKIDVQGDCAGKTYQVMGELPYFGAMGSGLPDAEHATGPEGVTRRVEPDSPMAHVFNVVCKP